MKEKTISYHTGTNKNYKAAHNRRDYKEKWPAHIDRSRTALNITMADESLADAYHRLFDEAIEKYNAKQTRSDRIIKNYLKLLQKSEKRSWVFETIVQFGDKDNTPEDNAVGVAVLQQYVKDFQKRNPQISVIGAYIHLDETTPHLHLDWISFATNKGQNARGPELVASLDKALWAQGYPEAKNRHDTPQKRWMDDERKAFDELCRARGYEVVHPEVGKGVEHLAIIEYKNQQEQKKLDALQKKIAEAEEQYRQLQLKLQALEN